MFLACCAVSGIADVWCTSNCFRNNCLKAGRDNDFLANLLLGPSLPPLSKKSSCNLGIICLRGAFMALQVLGLGSNFGQNVQRGTDYSRLLPMNETGYSALSKMAGPSSGRS